MPLSEPRTWPSLGALPRRLPAWADGQIATLHPGSFAVVMATGIVSNALFFQNHRHLSDILFIASATIFAWLVVITVVRALRFPRMLWSDLIDPRLVFSFFTFVAAADVFGAGAGLRGLGATAFHLWLIAFAVWLVLIYCSFAVLTFLNTAANTDVIDGGWLLAIVATESLVVLGATIAPSTKNFAAAIAVLVHMLWGLGLALYAIYMTQFIYRLFYGEVRPQHMTPILWVVMGAAAISANAGSALALAPTRVHLLHSITPFLDGATLIMWTWATFWIPLLLIFAIWKFAVHRAPLTYTPLQWGAVFPLGMYSVATSRFALAGDLPGLHAIAEAMLWVAVVAWVATLVAFAAACWRSFREFPDPAHGGKARSARSTHGAKRNARA